MRPLAKKYLRQTKDRDITRQTMLLASLVLDNETKKAVHNRFHCVA